jgi:hypothetical protein
LTKWFVTRARLQSGRKSRKINVGLQPLLISLGRTYLLPQAVHPLGDGSKHFSDRIWPFFAACKIPLISLPLSAAVDARALSSPVYRKFKKCFRFFIS